MSDQDRDGGRDQRRHQASEIEGNLSIQDALQITKPHQQHADSSERNCHDRRRNTTFDKITRIVELAVGAFVGGSLIYIGWMQYRIYSRQADIADAQIRAYVLLKKFDSSPGIPIFPNKKMTFIFRNFGSTPADLRDDGGDCRFYPNGTEPKKLARSSSPVFERMGFSKEGLLPPGWIMASGDEETFVIPLGANQDEISKARNGDGHIFCHFGISYQDALGNEHGTGACFRWLQQFNGFVLYNGPCNYHN